MTSEQLDRVEKKQRASNAPSSRESSMTAEQRGRVGKSQRAKIIERSRERAKEERVENASSFGREGAMTLEQRKSLGKKQRAPNAGSGREGAMTFARRSPLGRNLARPDVSPADATCRPRNLARAKALWDRDTRSHKSFDAKGLWLQEIWSGMATNREGGAPVTEATSYLLQPFWNFEISKTLRPPRRAA